MDGRHPSGYRTVGFLLALLAVVGLLLLLIDRATGGALPDIHAGTWRIPIGIPIAVVAALTAKGLLDVANRREAQ
ncbi:hypothetical protein OOJ91_12585 [Micromonospora lupini]|uniref:hypothetical protein n=1 Tax=Micromonospora lupini TaxID=285679 RepID=UPI00224FCE9E|nr:hypothetical protein [Micromonospora lupini]MCX5066717.1 hypothetical protein [Micromonospora lupini]